ncbi:MAG TPA: hypothetical protein VFV08_09380, partial [Puia sp.]|nr:hypothetical protein [Puia sp.]
MKYIFCLCLLLTSLDILAQNHNLEFYLSIARTNSPLLKDYRNQIAANQLDSQILRASYRVQVNGISNDSYAPVVNGFGYDNLITNGGQLSALVQANREIVSKKNLASQYQGIHLENETIGNTSVIAAKDLNKTVTAQYILVYGDFTTLQFNGEILDLLHKEEGILKNLTEENVYKQSDYLTFFVTYQQQQLVVRQSEIQFKNDFAMLNYLCGIVDTSAVTLPDPNLRMIELPNIYSTPFYQQYSIDSLKFLNQRSIVDFSYKPKVNIYADAG